MVGLNWEEASIACSLTVGELAANLSKLLRVQTKRFPIRVLKKRGEEQNSLHGVVLVGVTSQRWLQCLTFEIHER